MSIRTVSLLCAALIAGYAAVLVKAWGAPDGVWLDDARRPQQIDYLSLWAAGRLALEGRAEAAYDWHAHESAMAEGLGYEPKKLLPYSYPPPFQLVLAPLARLPYLPSMLLFSLASLALFAFVAANVVGRAEAALWMCATVPAFWNFAVGQSAALAVSLMGGALLVLPARPLLAGVLIGLLSFKPHLGLVVPFALLAAGHRRTVAAAAATVLVLALASALAFGLDAWAAFPGALSRFGAFVMSAGNHDAYKLQSVYGALRTLGLPPGLAIAAQAVAAAGIAALVALVWSRPGPFELKAGILAAAATLASPYVYHYDMLMLTLAQAFLIAYALPRNLTTRDVLVVVLVNVLITMTQPLAFPVGLVAAALMLGWLLHRLAIAEPRAFALPAGLVPSRLAGG